MHPIGIAAAIFLAIVLPFLAWSRAMDAREAREHEAMRDNEGR